MGARRQSCRTSITVTKVVIDKWLLPKGADFIFKATGAYFGTPNRTWEGWLKEMKAKRKA
jgi:hypothetical protein